MKRIKTGLEVVQSRNFDLFKGERLGLLVHSASINARLEHTVDIFLKKRGLKVNSLFGPQHGIYGETQDNMVEWEGFKDSRTGIPVYSLYGKHREPTEEMLKDLDTIVVDLQDVGSRIYTFIWTLLLTLKAASKYKKKVIVLDRPNPINGVDLEGSVIKSPYPLYQRGIKGDLPLYQRGIKGDFRSFVGLYPIPIRHGMTIGELALLFYSVGAIHESPLQVIEMEGWKREMWFDETGLPWVMPSPNMPTLDTAIVYPGMCLLEGTNLSEGRGTTKPFEVFGAPWVDPWVLSKEMRKMDLPGVDFRPLKFIPTFNKYKGKLCGGAQLHVRNRKLFRPFFTAVAILKTVKSLYPEHFRWRKPPYEYERKKLPIDILSGSEELRRGIEEKRFLREMENSWKKDVKAFQSLRKEFLLY